jgi:hypothetical protein
MPPNHSQASVRRASQIRSNHLLVRHQLGSAGLAMPLLSNCLPRSRRSGNRKLHSHTLGISQAMPLRRNHLSDSRRLGNRKVDTRAASRRVGRCGGRRKVRRRGGRGRLGGRRKLLGLSTGSRIRLAGTGKRRSDRRSRVRPDKMPEPPRLLPAQPGMAPDQPARALPEPPPHMLPAQPG